jgi:glycosyltransferase involved in cell wall biosynthesis
MAHSAKAKKLKILILEPYFGGSHKSFLTNLSRLPFSFDFMTLPARKWKWRMRLAAPFYAQQLHETGKKFDRILCSTFVDVASFRGLAPAWVKNVPVLTYFHENQFAYPMQLDAERDFHFALTNMTTALASDKLAFNSQYNLESFLKGIEKLEKKSYDLKLDDPGSEIRAKSQVIPPGVDFSAFDAAERPKDNSPPVLIWNHRWEHDKNPELFFNALFKLAREGVDFSLIVLGEHFKEHPAVFEKAREKLSSRILHFGYVKSRRDYARWLRKGDIAVSTAGHEFFGISVIEAVRAGCRPLLPKRLSYPELFPKEFLYKDKDLVIRLHEMIINNKRLSAEKAGILTNPFSWETLAPVYSKWISDSAIVL